MKLPLETQATLKAIQLADAQEPDSKAQWWALIAKYRSEIIEIKEGDNK